MNGITAHHHGRSVVAFDADGMLNASLLAKHYGRNPAEYLTAADSQHAIRLIDSKSSQLSERWQSNEVRSRHKSGYLRDLAAVGIIRQVAGDPGKHVAAGPNIPGNGVKNYDAGMWVHFTLAVGLARWLECRGENWKPSPLAEFVEQALAKHKTGQLRPIENAAPKSAADSFASTADALTLENLRQIDQLLIDGGLSFSERQQTLQARLDQRARQEANTQ